MRHGRRLGADSISVSRAHYLLNSDFTSKVASWIVWYQDYDLLSITSGIQPRGCFCEVLHTL